MVFGRKLARDKKFFQLDAKSKSEASDSEGRGKKGYRDYFGIGGEDLDNNDTTRNLLAGGGVGSGSDREETKNDRGRAAGDFKEGFDCGVDGHDDGGDVRVGFFGKNVWPENPGKPSISAFGETPTRYQAELVGGRALGQAADGDRQQQRGDLDDNNDKTTETFSNV